MKNIVILISGSGTNMQAIAEYFRDSTEIRVNRVISNRSWVGGLEKARAFNLPTDYINHEEKSREEFEKELLESVKKGDPDIIVLAGFMRILTKTFLEGISRPVFNIHPSLLPKHKGMKGVEDCIDSGDRISGMTIHKVTEELDGGPIVFQVPVLVDEGETYDSLYAKIQKLEHYYYPRVIEQYLKNS